MRRLPAAGVAFTKMGFIICLFLFASLLSVCRGQMHLVAFDGDGQCSRSVPSPFDINTAQLPEPMFAAPLVADNLFGAGDMDCSVISNQNDHVWIAPSAACKAVPSMVGGQPASLSGVLGADKKSAVWRWHGTQLWWPAPFAVDSKRSPVGLTGYFHKEVYGSPEEAAKHSDGIMAFAFSMGVQPEDNKDANAFFDIVGKKLKAPGASEKSESKQAVDWFTKKMNTSDYVTFCGTSMQPPFHPMVYVYSLQGDMTFISERQLKILKSITGADGGAVNGNARELQADPPAGSLIRVKSFGPPTPFVGWNWLSDIVENNAPAQPANVPAPPSLAGIQLT